MGEFILKNWVEALFGVIAAALSVCYRKLLSRVKKQDAVGMGVQALLRDRIIQAYNHYMNKGYCPIYGLENVEEMYKQYHALGGNGTITELCERLKELPSEPMDEKPEKGEL